MGNYELTQMFDIDKLFFVRYNYRNIDGKLQKVTMKEGDTLETASTEAVQNHMLDAYRGILLSEPNLIQATTPLGGTTGDLKDMASLVTISEWSSTPDGSKYITTFKEAMDKAGKPSSPELAYKHYRQHRKNLVHTTPLYHAAVKYKYSGGKSGVGPSALNNVHHILCQIADIELTSDLLFTLPAGLSNITTLNNKTSNYDLYEINDKGQVVDKPQYQSKDISSWLSAMIDAHVDIAKDPYIMTLNVNKHTYNTTFLLLRLGLGEQTFRFLSQPILKTYVRYKDNEGGKIKPKLTKAFYRTRNEYVDVLSKQFKLKDAEIEARLNNAKEKLNLVESKSLMKAITLPVNERTTEWYIFQLAVLDTFKDIENGAGRALNNFVMASRVDTKKYGKNIVEIMEYLKSVQSVLRSNSFINIDKVLNFNGTVNDGYTFVPSYLKNGPVEALNLFKQLTVSATPEYYSLVEGIANFTGTLSKGEQKSARYTQISNKLMSSLQGQFFTDNVLGLGLTKKDIHNVFKNVDSIITKIATDNKYSYLKNNNKLVKLLIEGKYQDRNVEKDITFYGLPSIYDTETYNRNNITFAWQDLLDDDSAEIRELGNELFIYSFYTSGFNRGSNTFDQFAPARLKDELIYKEDKVKSLSMYLKDIHNQFTNGTAAIESVKEKMIREVYQNNWFNTKLVPIVSTYKEYADVDGVKLYTFKQNKEDIQDHIVRGNEPYVLFKSGQGNTLLYERVGYDRFTSESVYRKVDKKGYNSTQAKGSYKGYTAVEYGLDGASLFEYNGTSTTKYDVNDFMNAKDSFVQESLPQLLTKSIKDISVDLDEDLLDTSPNFNDDSIGDINILSNGRSFNREAENGLKLNDIVISQEQLDSINTKFSKFGKVYTMDEINKLSDEDKQNLLTCI